MALINVLLLNFILPKNNKNNKLELKANKRTVSNVINFILF